MIRPIRVDHTNFFKWLKTHSFNKMTENERRVIQHDSRYAQVQLAGKGEGAYPARREGRAVRLARRLTRLQDGIAKCHAGAALAPCAPHARNLHKNQMTENERRAMGHSARFAVCTSSISMQRKGAYRARREGRAACDARGAELATRELAMHPAVRHDAKVRHGRAILGGVGHRACVRSALPPFPGAMESKC
jgi:hypothetical protein